MAHLYQVCGQTSTGEVIRYPLTTQIVAEVPESLETSQKQDRRRACIFATHREDEVDSRLSMADVDRDSASLSMKFLMKPFNM